MCNLFTFAPHAGAGTFFSLLRQRKESKRKATAGTGLASPNFPHFARFFGRARNLRLRRFEHASPCSPKNRALLGCASRRMARPIGLGGELTVFILLDVQGYLKQYVLSRLP